MAAATATAAAAATAATAVGSAGTVVAIVVVALAIVAGFTYVALVKGEAINFSMNTKYFAFSFRIGVAGTERSQGGPGASIGTVPGQWALRAGESKIVLASLDVKMSKRKPTLDLEPKKETITNEEFVEEPKKEKTSDEEPRDETNPSEKPKDDPGDSPENEKSPGNRAIKTVIGATVGAGVALVAIPACIGALGFTGAGITAGSIAAKMMSAAAIANGGGVAAGSTVAVLQSVAAGFPFATKTGLTSVASPPPEERPKADFIVDMFGVCFRVEELYKQSRKHSFQKKN